MSPEQAVSNVNVINHVVPVKCLTLKLTKRLSHYTVLRASKMTGIYLLYAFQFFFSTRILKVLKLCLHFFFICHSSCPNYCDLWPVGYDDSARISSAFVSRDPKFKPVFCAKASTKGFVPVFTQVERRGLHNAQEYCKSFFNFY